MRSIKLNRYYLDQPGEGLLTGLHKWLTRRPVPKFPRTLQIQTVTGCQADCIFCPFGETFDLQPKGRMDPDLFRRIIAEARRHGVRRISPYLMNEPFIDKDLFSKIVYIHEQIPDSKVVVTTNGGVLTRARVDEMLDIGDALKALYVSFQGIEKDAYEKTMRGAMHFEHTMENINYLLEQQRKRVTEYPRVWITMVSTEIIDAKKAVAYWKKRGVRTKYTALENRGGNIADAESYSTTGAMQYFSTCTRLFKQGYINFNGDMVLCCTDYSRKQVLGNIRDSSIYDVWNGEKAMDIRRRFLGGRIDTIDLCCDCKVDEEVEVEG
ncbi:MAG: radical SAM/SPASM domain-containing protein [Acidobacteriota bacterium]